MYIYIYTHNIDYVVSVYTYIHNLPITPMYLFLACIQDCWEVHGEGLQHQLGCWYFHCHRHRCVDQASSFGTQGLGGSLLQMPVIQRICLSVNSLFFSLLWLNTVNETVSKEFKSLLGETRRHVGLGHHWLLQAWGASDCVIEQTLTADGEVCRAKPEV